MLGRAKEKPNVGDTVLLRLGRDSFTSVRLVAGSTERTSRGVFHHDDMIDKPFGSRIFPRKSQGWVHLLPLTPELWTRSVVCRTQVLFSPDISIITSHLGLKPGMVVAESGTGSGSLTSSLARTVAPTGHVFTFEFHKGRADAAREDFVANGIGDIVTVEHRDVCENGFGLVDAVDAVFLDLPRPWGALPSAHAALRSGGSICSFSPCIEQVTRMCAALADLGFAEIVTSECMLREYDVRSGSLEHPVGFPRGQDPLLPTAPKRARLEPVETLMTRPLVPARGHTGYLTCAYRAVR